MKFVVDRVSLFRNRVAIRAYLPPEQAGDQVNVNGVLCSPPCVLVAYTTPFNPHEAVELEPLLNLTQQEAQELVDQLWEAGIRPSNGAGSTGQLGAVLAHLDDMRRIVGHHLRVELRDKP